MYALNIVRALCYSLKFRCIILVSLGKGFLVFFYGLDPNLKKKDKHYGYPF